MRWLAVAMAIACIALILLGICGCRFPKASVLSAYESVVQFAGQFALTPAIQLQGVRSFGESHIEGAYTAQYEGYSVDAKSGTTAFCSTAKTRITTPSGEEYGGAGAGSGCFSAVFPR